MTSPISQRPQSIAGRLLLFSGLFVTCVLIVAAVILWLALQSVVREQIDQRLDTQINALAGALVPGGNGRMSLLIPLDAPPFDRPGSGWYWQVESQGQTLVSRSLLQGAITAPPPKSDWRHMVTGMPVPGEGMDNKERALYLRQAVRTIDGKTLTITATAPLDTLVEPVIKAMFWLVPSMLLLGGILLLGTLWQIRFGLRPLKQMTQDLEAIDCGELSRLPAQPTAELTSLSLKTNALIETNAERLAATRMQFANLAHGLKTPVASLLIALDDRNDPEGALRKLTEKIDHRIKHHLSAARRVAAAGSAAASTPVARSVRDVQKAVGLIHADRNIRFELHIAADLAVACDESDLEEMLGNLIENAFKWARSAVTVTARRHGATVEIMIDDDGPGIAQDRLDAVLLPGIREDEHVPGNGFGLTIVKELAELYGGSVSLTNRPQQGLRAQLVLASSVRPRG